MPLPPTSLSALRAALDRIIPRDEFPGATDAGADGYILRQLAGDCVLELPLIRDGLTCLDAEARATGATSFASLGEKEQDALLAAIERGEVRTIWSVAPIAWFARLVELTAEGYYADPGNGGNRGGVAWKMLGYDPRTPRRVTIAGKPSA